MRNNSIPWTADLPEDVYFRLCECRSRREDLPVLVGHRWHAMKQEGKQAEGFTKEDALVDVLELLDANGQWRLCDMTRAEYDALKGE